MVDGRKETNLTWELFVSRNWRVSFAFVRSAEAVFVERALEVDHFVNAVAHADASAFDAIHDAINNNHG